VYAILCNDFFYFQSLWKCYAADKNFKSKATWKIHLKEPMQSTTNTWKEVAEDPGGLPDGFKPKSQFGYILGLGMDNVDMFYGQLEHFTAIRYLYFIAIGYIVW
jgi:hypothetical protein